MYAESPEYAQGATYMIQITGKPLVHLLRVYANTLHGIGPERPHCSSERIRAALKWWMLDAATVFEGADFARSLAVAPALRQLVRKGLVLVGASETRRIYVLLVAYFEQLSHQAYLDLQASAKLCQQQKGQLEHPLPGLQCDVVNQSSAVVFEYIRFGVQLYFVWNSDLESNSTGSLTDRLHSISTRCIDLTVYFNVPLSHMLFNPSARKQNFCELLKSNDGEFDAILRRKLSMLLRQILKLQFLKLLVSLGHPYCCFGPSRSPQICEPNDLHVHQNLTTTGEVGAVDHTPIDCICNMHFDKKAALETGDEPLTTDSRWTPRCDRWLQTNQGVRNANRIVLEVLQELNVGIVDVFSAATRSITKAAFRDECRRTHWPFHVIVEQINRIAQAAGV